MAEAWWTILFIITTLRNWEIIKPTTPKPTVKGPIVEPDMSAAKPTTKDAIMASDVSQLIATNTNNISNRSGLMLKLLTETVLSRLPALSSVQMSRTIKNRSHRIYLPQTNTCIK
jgi:hypothetical protein